MEIKVGQLVRSYDWAGHTDNYVEGIVEKIGPWEGCAAGCDHYHIRCTRRVFGGKEEKPEHSHFYPAVNFMPGITLVEPVPVTREAQLMQAFHQLKTHHWLARSFAKLNTEERAEAEQFIRVFGNTTRDTFEQQVNRMYLDRPKSKNWTAVVELLSSANSKVRP